MSCHDLVRHRWVFLGLKLQFELYTGASECSLKPCKENYFSERCNYQPEWYKLILLSLLGEMGARLVFSGT